MCLLELGSQSRSPNSCPSSSTGFHFSVRSHPAQPPCQLTSSLHPVPHWTEWLPPCGHKCPDTRAHFLPSAMKVMGLSSVIPGPRTCPSVCPAFAQHIQELGPRGTVHPSGHCSALGRCLESRLRSPSAWALQEGTSVIQDSPLKISGWVPAGCSFWIHLQDLRT